MKDLTIIIKTLDRYICLKPLLKSILKKYNDIPILIGDDSKVSCEDLIKKDFLNNKNIKVYKLPYDCGLSYGRNFLVNKVKTKYLCLCDDDFIFDKKTDLKLNLDILKEKDVDILGGYIRNYKIVSSMKDKLIKLAQKILHYELPTNYIGTINESKNILYVDYKRHSFPEYEESDIVLNFFIAKTKVLKENPWDEDLKLQEHTAFFYMAKKHKLKVAFSNKLSVRHCPIQDPKYKNFRTRNYTHVFMEKNNIKKIVSTYDDESRNCTIELPKIDNIKFSVIIPSYNSEGKINLLLKTLKEQTYKNFEVLIVDNNSTDNSLDYIKKETKSDKRFKILKETKQGPNYARKKGFMNATGDYLYFCDADDYLEDDTLYDFAKEITKSKSDIVIGNYIEHNTYYTKFMNGVFNPIEGNQKDNNSILLIKPALWNKAIKKDLVDENSFIFTYISEDLLISVLAMARAKKISYINNVVYHYLLDDFGLSSKIKYNSLVNLIDSQKQILEIFKKVKLYDKYKQEIDYICLSHTIYKMFRITLLNRKIERNQAYEEFIKHLKTLDNNNQYLKKSFAFSKAYIIVKNKLLFKIFTPCIRITFKNKILNKLLKKLDK